MSRAGSSRWSPTPEQLMILEQLYRSGIRTPTASQIQHITTHLCFYGRIEGKNVFYWFQNHKARDRQKLRRKLNKQLQLQQQQQHMFAHQCQVINHHEDNKTHWYFSGFDSCSPGSSSTQQVPFINPAVLLSQGETSSETWKSSGGQKQEQQQSEAMDDRRKMTSPSLYSSNINNNGGMSSSYCCWSVNEEESSYAYCCCCSSSSSSSSSSNRPLLKTLDLFPTSSSKLKEHPFNP